MVGERNEVEWNHQERSDTLGLLGPWGSGTHSIPFALTASFHSVHPLSLTTQPLATWAYGLFLPLGPNDPSLQDQTSIPEASR